MSIPTRSRRAKQVNTRSTNAAVRVASPRNRIGRRLLSFVPILLVCAGILVLLFPVVSTRMNDARQREIAQQYEVETQQAGPDVLQQHLQEAYDYNEHLESHPILDPWLSRVSPDTEEYQRYLGVLNQSGVMGRIVIPKIRVNLPILHGTSEQTLSRGIGHLFGTSLPVGGPSTHSVLTGHTGLGTATLFDNLTSLVVDDYFYVHASGSIIKYRVSNIQTVLPEQTDALSKVSGKDLITLITCTPYGVNSHRLLVTGERVPMDPQQASAEIENLPEPPAPWWMTGIIVGVVVIVVVTLGIVVRAWWSKRKRRLFLAGKRNDREGGRN